MKVLNVILLRSIRHVIEVKQNEAIYKKSEAQAAILFLNLKMKKILDLNVVSTLYREPCSVRGG